MIFVLYNIIYYKFFGNIIYNILGNHKHFFREHIVLLYVETKNYA